MSASRFVKCPLCLRPMAAQGDVWRCARCQIVVPDAGSPLHVDFAAGGPPSGGEVLAITESLVWVQLPGSGQSRWVRRSAVVNIQPSVSSSGEAVVAEAHRTHQIIS